MRGSRLAVKPTSTINAVPKYTTQSHPIIRNTSAIMAEGEHGGLVRD